MRVTDDARISRAVETTAHLKASISQQQEPSQKAVSTAQVSPAAIVELSSNAQVSRAGRWTPSPDINRDGYVDQADMDYLKSEWGKSKSRADLDQNGQVNVDDLVSVILNWGKYEDPASAAASPVASRAASPATSALTSSKNTPQAPAQAVLEHAVTADATIARPEKLAASQPQRAAAEQSNSKHAVAKAERDEWIPNPDIDGDGKVGERDLAYLLEEWGSGRSRADLNQDGNVGFADLVALLGHWGKYDETT